MYPLALRIAPCSFVQPMDVMSFRLLSVYSVNQMVLALSEMMPGMIRFVAPISKVSPGA